MTERWRRWYKNNTGELSERRKRRYASDPEYRERCKANAQAARANAKARGEPYSNTPRVKRGTHPRDLPVLKNGYVKWW